MLRVGLNKGLGLEDEGSADFLFLLSRHFLISLPPSAICAVKEMQAAPDFDRNMLLLATQICHRSEQKRILLSVLVALLDTLKLGSSREIVVEAVALLRCIIKLILGLLVDPLSNRYASSMCPSESPTNMTWIRFRRLLIDTLVSHFRTGIDLTS